MRVSKNCFEQMSFKLFFCNPDLIKTIFIFQMAFFHLVTGDSQGLPTLRTLSGIIVVYLTIHTVGDVMAKKSG